MGETLNSLIRGSSRARCVPDGEEHLRVVTVAHGQTPHDPRRSQIQQVGREQRRRLPELIVPGRQDWVRAVGVPVERWVASLNSP